MSGLDERAGYAPQQRFTSAGLGQNCPQHCPGPGSSLGTPLSIREAAQLIGCSAWTVRQRHVPSGLPCLRSGPQGKLIFYRDQVVQWILHQQQKGGM
jgi:hypothetical protein